MLAAGKHVCANNSSIAEQIVSITLVCIHWPAVFNRATLRWPQEHISSPPNRSTKAIRVSKHSTRTQLWPNPTIFLDKLCDIVSDAVLDACLSQDPDSKVACETCTKTGMVMIFGEITTKATVNYEQGEDDQEASWTRASVVTLCMCSDSRCDQRYWIRRC